MHRRVLCDENQSESRMPEIGTSGSMSGDGKRSVATWPKLPRPSSTLPKRRFAATHQFVAIGGIADIARSTAAPGSDANDPERSLASEVCCDAQQCRCGTVVSLT